MYYYYFPRWTERELAAQIREWDVGVRTTDEWGREVPFEMRQRWNYRIEQRQPEGAKKVRTIIEGMRHVRMTHLLGTDWSEARVR
jgi:hypothetical protein